MDVVSEQVIDQVDQKGDVDLIEEVYEWYVKIGVIVGLDLSFYFV